MPTCNQCGEDGLRWALSADDYWVLLDEDDTPHACMRVHSSVEDDFGVNTPEPTEEEWSAGEQA